MLRWSRRRRSYRATQQRRYARFAGVHQELQHRSDPDPDDVGPLCSHHLTMVRTVGPARGGGAGLARLMSRESAAAAHWRCRRRFPEKSLENFLLRNWEQASYPVQKTPHIAVPESAPRLIPSAHLVRCRQRRAAPYPGSVDSERILSHRGTALPFDRHGLGKHRCLPAQLTSHLKGTIGPAGEPAGGPAHLPAMADLFV
jgi:hypothetical protein